MTEEKSETEEGGETGAVDPVAASIATAKEMLTHPGQTAAKVGAWLHAQCPGEFESPEHAAEELT